MCYRTVKQRGFVIFVEEENLLKWRIPMADVRRNTPCACGVRMTPKQLRVHIALCTEHWPLIRCTEEHHDPLNLLDKGYLAGKRAGLINIGHGRAVE